MTPRRLLLVSHTPFLPEPADARVEVQQVATPEEARRLLAAGGVDAVVLHHALGTDALQAWRDALQAPEAVPVLVVTDLAAEWRRQRAEQRHRFLVDAGRTLAVSLDYEATLRSLAQLVVPGLADWCIVDVVDEEGEVQVVQVAADDPRTGALLDTMLRRYPHDRRRRGHPVTEVLRDGEPRLYAELSPAMLEQLVDDPVQLQLLRELGPGSAMTVPMLAHGRPLGALTVALRGPRRRFRESDLELCMDLARQGALEIENARLYRAARAEREEAERAAQLRDEVVGFVAHDLRNPVAAIRMQAASLAERAATGSTEQGQLASIIESTTQIDRLIQDLLDITRIEAGQLRIEPRPEQPATLIGESLAQLAPLAHAAGVALQQVEDATASTAAAAVLADRERVLQVFSNLVGNALRFTPAGGTVEVRAVQEEGDAVRFTVRDSGPGIAAEDLPRVFDRFWQGREAARSRRNPGGAGLGLAIVRGIVEAHGGQVGVESQPGEGSTFWFTLPSLAAGDEAAAPPEGAPTSLAPWRSRGVLRVLLVDDHPIVRRGLEELLRRAPHVQVVGTASSGEEALAEARRLAPDIVVMDLGMPGMGGLRAIEALCAEPAAPRVLALTADVEEESLLPVLRAGGSGYVRKTFAHRELVEALETVARGEVYLYPSATRLLLDAYRELARSGARDLLRGLAPRELEILTLTAEGYTAAEIARRFGLSPHTIETQRSRLMYKLGLAHRAELVKFAIRAGLLREPSG